MTKLVPTQPEALAGPASRPAQAGMAPGGTTDTRSLERMARLRHLVRDDGMDLEAAAQELGIDPIIAQLWLRLPDDLWPAARAAGGAAPAAAASLTPPVLPRHAPVSGLRRVITCRIPTPALDRLRAGETPLLDAASTALEVGLAQPRPPVSAGGWRFARRPLAVPVTADAYTKTVALAGEAFNGDVRDAAGWLIARGVGMTLPLPTAEELSGTLRLPLVAAGEKPVSSPVRFVVPPRRRPETRSPLPPDDSAPDGDELRRRREAAGLSQRDLAAASGLSRGLVAEIERGRRRHVLTRLKLAETLASVERGKVAQA